MQRKPLSFYFIRGLVLAMMCMLIGACGLIMNSSPTDPATLVRTAGPLQVTPYEETVTAVPTPIPTLERSGALCYGQPLDIAWKDNLLAVGAVRSLGNKPAGEVLFAGGKKGEIWTVNLTNDKVELCQDYPTREDGQEVAINQILVQEFDGLDPLVSFSTDGQGVPQFMASAGWSSLTGLPDDRTYCVKEYADTLVVCTIAKLTQVGFTSIVISQPPDAPENFHDLLIDESGIWYCSIFEGSFHTSGDDVWDRYDQNGISSWNGEEWVLEPATPKYPNNCRNLAVVNERIAIAGDEVSGSLAFIPASENPVSEVLQHLTAIAQGPGGSYFVAANPGGVWLIMPGAEPKQLAPENAYAVVVMGNDIYAGTDLGIRHFEFVLP